MPRPYLRRCFGAPAGGRRGPLGPRHGAAWEWNVEDPGAERRGRGRPRARRSQTGRPRLQSERSTPAPTCHPEAASANGGHALLGAGLPGALRLKEAGQRSRRLLLETRAFSGPGTHPAGPLVSVVCSRLSREGNTVRVTYWGRHVPARGRLPRGASGHVTAQPGVVSERGRRGRRALPPSERLPEGGPRLGTRGPGCPVAASPARPSLGPNHQGPGRRPAKGTEPRAEKALRGTGAPCSSTPRAGPGRVRNCGPGSRGLRGGAGALPAPPAPRSPPHAPRPAPRAAALRS